MGCVSKIKSILSIIFCMTDVAVCFQFTDVSFDDWGNICPSSHYHRQFGNGIIRYRWGWVIIQLLASYVLICSWQLSCICMGTVLMDVVKSEIRHAWYFGYGNRPLWITHCPYKASCDEVSDMFHRYLPSCPSGSFSCIISINELVPFTMTEELFGI